MSHHVMSPNRSGLRAALTSRRSMLVITALLLLLFTSGCKKINQLKKAVKTAEKTKSALEGPVILTGGKTGNYFKTANELNEVLSDKLTVKTSKGSFENLEQLGQGKAKYAIVQFDTLLMFLRMGGRYKNYANNSLGVAPLSNEQVHIIVRKGAKIKTIADLKNKRIGTGSKGSGSFISAFTLMVYFNDVNLDKYKNAFHEPYEKSLEKLKKGELDALFITSAPGMPLLKNLPADMKQHIELLDVGSNIKIPKSISFAYTPEPLPKGSYPWQEKEINQLATPAYLFAYAKYNSNDVKRVSKEIYENAEKLQKKSKLFALTSRDQAEKHQKFGIGFHGGTKIYLRSTK